MKSIIVSVLVLSSSTCSVYAKDLFHDISCYYFCFATPSGNFPLGFFNISVFQQSESCQALPSGLYIAQQGSIVFIHNNAVVCETINKKVPGPCFNSIDGDAERIKHLNSPADELRCLV